MQLFVWEDETPHAAMVTTINNRKAGRECTLLVVGGDKMDEWIDVLPQVEDWARELNCDEMSIYGRIGWAKALGYKIDYAKMSQKL